MKTKIIQGIAINERNVIKWTSGRYFTDLFPLPHENVVNYPKLFRNLEVFYDKLEALSENKFIHVLNIARPIRGSLAWLTYTYMGKLDDFHILIQDCLLEEYIPDMTIENKFKFVILIPAEGNELMKFIKLQRRL